MRVVWQEPRHWAHLSGRMFLFRELFLATIVINYNCTGNMIHDNVTTVKCHSNHYKYFRSFRGSHCLLTSKYICSETHLFLVFKVSHCDSNPTNPARNNKRWKINPESKIPGANFSGFQTSPQHKTVSPSSGDFWPGLWHQLCGNCHLLLQIFWPETWKFETNVSETLDSVVKLMHLPSNEQLSECCYLEPDTLMMPPICWDCKVITAERSWAGD